MPGLSYNNAGAWVDIAQPYYNDAGTWRTLSEVHYNDAGVWRKVFPGSAGLAAALTATTISAAGDPLLPQTALATFELNADGYAYKTATDGVGGSTRTQLFQWKTGGGLASAYEAVATTVSGAPSSGTIGTAVNLGTTATWTRNRVTAGSSSWVGGFVIQPAGGGAALAGSTNMTLQATS